MCNVFFKKKIGLVFFQGCKIHTPLYLVFIGGSGVALLYTITNTTFYLTNTTSTTHSNSRSVILIFCFFILFCSC